MSNTHGYYVISQPGLGVFGPFSPSDVSSSAVIAEHADADDEARAKALDARLKHAEVLERAAITRGLAETMPTAGRSHAASVSVCLGAFRAQASALTEAVKVTAAATAALDPAAMDAAAESMDAAGSMLIPPLVMDGLDGDRVRELAGEMRTKLEALGPWRAQHREQLDLDLPEVVKPGQIKVFRWSQVAQVRAMLKDQIAQEGAADGG